MITIEVDSFEEVGAALAEIFDGLGEQMLEPAYSVPLRASMRDIEDTHAGYFNAARDPSGAPWAPLAPSTIKKKGHATILIDTTRLRQSLTGNTGHSVRDVGDVGPNAYLTFGTTVPYAAVHMTGRESPPMPARPHTGVTEELVDKIAGRIADHIVQRLAQGS